MKRRAVDMEGLSFKSVFSRVGLCYMALMLVTQGLQMAAAALWPQALNTGWGLWVLSYAPLYCVAAPVFAVMMRATVPDAPGTRGTAALSGRGWLRWFIICIGVTYAFNFVSLGITALLGLLKGSAVQNPLVSMQAGSSLPASFLFACVLAPVGEEILFRKLLHDKLGAYGPGIYVPAGAFLFALFHANLSQLLYAFVLGAIFCYIYACTGKLRYTIALHMAINTLGIVVAPSLAAVGQAWSAAVVSVLVAGGIAGGAVLAARGRWRFAAPAPREDDVMKPVPAPRQTGGAEGPLPPRPLRAALCTPGMLAYTVLCAALIAVVTFLT